MCEIEPRAEQYELAIDPDSLTHEFRLLRQGKERESGEATTRDRFGLERAARFSHQHAVAAILDGREYAEAQPVAFNVDALGQAAKVPREMLSGSRAR